MKNKSSAPYIKTLCLDVLQLYQLLDCIINHFQCMSLRKRLATTSLTTREKSSVHRVTHLEHAACERIENHNHWSCQLRCIQVVLAINSSTLLRKLLRLRIGRPSLSLDSEKLYLLLMSSRTYLKHSSWPIRRTQLVLLSTRTCLPWTFAMNLELFWVKALQILSNILVNPIHADTSGRRDHL